jgi:hypothetical protein
MKFKHLFSLTLFLACALAWAQNKPKYSYTYQMPLPSTFGNDISYVIHIDLAQLSPDEYAIIEQIFQQLSISEPEMDSIPRILNDIVGIKAKLNNPITRDALPKNLYIGSYKELPSRVYRIRYHDFICKFIKKDLALWSLSNTKLANGQQVQLEKRILLLSPNEAILKQYDLIAGNTLASDERWISPPSHLTYYTYKQHFLPITLVSDKLNPTEIATLLDQKIPRWKKENFYPQPPNMLMFANVLCAIKSRGYEVKDELIMLPIISPEVRKIITQFQKDHNILSMAALLRFLNIPY